MASVPPNHPGYYRQRAAEVRALAADFTDVELRSLMARMAAEYDDVADRMERAPSNRVWQGSRAPLPGVK